MSCEAIIGAIAPDVIAMSATLVPASAGVPEFCRVVALGSPQVQMEFALPTRWNERLYMQGNGGFAGEALDAPERIANRNLALQNGFVAMQTNTGHDTPGQPVGAWAANHPELIDDFAHRAVHLTNQAARALVARYYARAPRHAYFHACSTGGRQALISAQRYPGDFDGYVGNAPVQDWTHTFVGFAWNQQALAQAPLTVGKLATVHAAVIDKCDALDGVRDGRIRDPRLCSLVFDVRRDVAACAPGVDDDRCLTSAQVGTLEKLWSGPISRGRRLFPGFSIDTEPAQLAPWMLGTTLAPPIERSYGIAHWTYFTPYPATDTRDFSFDRLDFDIDPFRQEALHAVIDASSADLSAFRAGEGKFISVHGTSDPALTPFMSIDYAERLAATMGATSEFYRLYLDPGMAHCDSGTRAADTFDAMTPLIDWVEAAVAPQAITAAKIDDSGQIEFTRKLCPYPLQETFLGGDMNSASSFACAPAAPVIAELQYGGTSHYVLSANLSEAYDVAAGSFGIEWQKTGRVWTAWPAGAPGTVPVYRFYFPSVVEGGAHFYTLDAHEAQTLRDARSPWIDEGPQFGARALSACASGDVVLVRYYKGDVSTGLPRHRYVPDDSGAGQLLAQGWIREGEVMCVSALPH